MRSRVGVVIAAVFAVGFAAAIASGGAVEVAKVGPRSGASTITHNGQTSNVGETTQFQEGDIVRVPTDGRLTVEFGDGSTIAMVGPAAVRFGEITPTGRRLVLGSGVITEATVYGIAMEIQAPTPYDASCVLQNARAFARVTPGDRVSFQKLEGNYAKAWRDGKFSDLSDNFWTLNVRDGTVTNGPAAAAAGQRGARTGIRREQKLPNDMVRMILGDREIMYHPASSFGREMTSDGGMKLTFQGAADDFGVVEIGLEVTLFLAPGQSVELAGNGDVTRFDGVSHQYGRLFAPIMWDEPVENAIDASPSYSKSH